MAHWSRPGVHGAQPLPVRSHTMTLVGSKLFVFGGSTFDDDKFLELMIFDTETMFWSKPETNSAPGIAVGPHRAHTATLVGDKIYIFGGGDGPHYFDKLYVLDTKTLTWSEPKVGGTGPGPRRAHTATVVGNKIYIFGGGDGNKALNEVFVLDTERMAWSECKASGAKGDGMPAPRGYHTATLIDSTRILVFGGSDGQEGFSDLHLLDTATNSWSRAKVVNPFPRLAHTATLVGPTLFVFGGQDGCDYTNELTVLNLETMEWSKMSTTGNAPSARGYHTSVLTDSRLFVFGGYDNERCFDEMHVLDLGTLSYLTLNPASWS